MVLLQKYWRKNWFVLYPASQYGISRLEFFDTKDGVNVSEKQTTKKMDKKIIRLSDCISITQVPNEVCPKDSMSAFTIETEEKLYTFAAEKTTSAEWLEILCETAFPPPAVDTFCGSKSLEMAENSIYYSRSEVSAFWVNMQKTEAAERCNLHGTYILQADKTSLLLKDTKTKEVLFKWPYQLMRRYGRDKVMFSFEAGRRCDSGPGNFTFETKHGNDIFLIVESCIQEQKAEAEGNHRSHHPSEPGDGSGSADSLTTDQSPPNSAGVSSSSGAKGNPSSRAGGAEVPAAKKEQVASKGLEEKDLSKHLKARSLPDPPNTSPPTPPRSPVVKHVVNSDPTSIYSDPLDALSTGNRNLDSLYSDPLDSVPKAPSVLPTPRQVFKNGKAQGRHVEPLYADIYEQVGYEFSRATISAKPEEHIYDEPEGRAPQQLPEGRAPHPLPVPTPIYDEAKQEKQDSWKKRVLYPPTTDNQCMPPSSKSSSQVVAKPRKPRSKPLPAPKPTSRLFVKDKQADIKETGKVLANPAPEKSMLRSNFNSSNNCIYSKVTKTKKLEMETSVDELTINQDSDYEDLGNL
ncbi:docking protein 1b [Narcine bancroftii]|uniref:docking protein 1b n=1 Tax=Narcine bancroftii TaxID=1343680 RepID=UPI003831DFBE